MKKLKKVKNMTRDEWLKERKKGIGGSDAAAVCGLNKWKSPFGVYLDKIGEGVANSDSERLRQGRDFEEYVAKRFEEATGKKVRRNNFMMIDENFPFMIADIDREIVGENSILEIKTVSPFAKKAWKDGDIPQNYQIQCLHYMAVTGAEKCYVAALVFGEEFIIRVIERDEETIQMLRDIEKEFWTKYIEGDEVPPADGSSDYENILKEKYKNSINNCINIDLSDINMQEYEERKTLIDELTTQNKVIEQTIKAQMGENDRGTSGDYEFSWKQVSSNRFDGKGFKKDYPDLYEKYTKSNSYRRFGIKKNFKED